MCISVTTQMMHRTNKRLAIREEYAPRKILNELISLEELETAFKHAATQKEMFVEIRGDAAAKHGRIMQIMNLCRKCGVTQYSLTQRIVNESP